MFYSNYGEYPLFNMNRFWWSDAVNALLHFLPKVHGLICSLHALRVSNASDRFSLDQELCRAMVRYGLASRPPGFAM